MNKCLTNEVYDKIVKIVFDKDFNNIVLKYKNNEYICTLFSQSQIDLDEDIEDPKNYTFDWCNELIFEDIVTKKLFSVSFNNLPDEIYYKGELIYKK